MANLPEHHPGYLVFAKGSVTVLVKFSSKNKNKNPILNNFKQLFNG